MLLLTFLIKIKKKVENGNLQTGCWEAFVTNQTRLVLCSSCTTDADVQSSSHSSAEISIQLYSYSHACRACASINTCSQFQFSMRPVPRRLAGDKLGAQRSPWAWRHHNVSTVQSCTRQEAHISVWWMAFYYYYYELKHHDSSARLPGVPLGRASKHRFWCTVYGLLWKRNDFQSLHDMLLLKSSKSKKIVAWWLFF